MMHYKTFLISCLCIMTAFVLVKMIPSGQNVEVIEKKLDKLPYRIGNYTGVDMKLEDGVVKELDTDVYIFRRYLKEQDEEITLYIGYYGTRKGGRTGHVPEACYPAVGWGILDESRVKVPVLFDGKDRMITINSLKVKKGNTTGLVYHWYQSSGDKVLSSGVAQNLQRFKTKILYNRDDGAFIRVSAPVTQSLSYTKNGLDSFIKKLYPLIVKYWPEEKEI